MYGIAIFLIALVIVTAGIIVTTIPSDTDSRADVTEQSSGLYEIPIHVYEMWNSQEIVIHGNVDVQNDDHL